jgi:hypothetical protein
MRVSPTLKVFPLPRDRISMHGSMFVFSIAKERRYMTLLPLKHYTLSSQARTLTKPLLFPLPDIPHEVSTIGCSPSTFPHCIRSYNDPSPQGFTPGLGAHNLNTSLKTGRDIVLKGGDRLGIAGQVFGWLHRRYKVAHQSSDDCAADRRRMSKE